MRKRIFTKISPLAVILVAICASAVAGYHYFYTDQKTVIKQQDMESHVEKGRIRGGLRQSVRMLSDSIQTTEPITYESPIIEPKDTLSNAAVINWDEENIDNSTSPTRVEVRTHNGSEWSEWVQVSSGDGKDDLPVTHSALVLADKIQQVQYRMGITPLSGQEAMIKDIHIQSINTTVGPTLAREKMKQTIARFFRGDVAHAKADSPYIYNRAQWGCPEPYGSEWPPEYQPLHRVIVHHTATTFSGDTFAAVRAIWQYHTYTNGWGDIGYNYLVDPYGNMVQGRYYDYNEAERLHADVIGGHAYGNNRGTTGISVLGNYTNQVPTNDVLYSVARLASYKASPYGFNPAEDNPTFGQQLVGHRDVYQTSCPGQKLYDKLQTIRDLVKVYYPVYDSYDRYDFQYVGQYVDDEEVAKTIMWPETTRRVSFVLRNTGYETWTTDSVMLGTDSPKDRKSPFCDVSWIGQNCDRPSTTWQKQTINTDGTKSYIPTTTAAPGEVVKITFTMKSPYAGGNYDEHFSLVVPGKTWFLRNISPSVAIYVPNPLYSWKWVSQDLYQDNTKTVKVAYNSLRPGDRVYMTLTAQNNSNQTWYRDGPYQVRLGTNGPQDRQSMLCDVTWSVQCNRATTLVEPQVAPGQNGTFEFWAKIPANTKPGQYTERFNLVMERRSWLSEQGLYWQITVN